jgi:hypothetical protein
MARHKPPLTAATLPSSHKPTAASLLLINVAQVNEIDKAGSKVTFQHRLHCRLATYLLIRRTSSLNLGLFGATAV